MTNDLKDTLRNLAKLSAMLCIILTWGLPFGAVWIAHDKHVTANPVTLVLLIMLGVSITFILSLITWGKAGKWYVIAFTALAIVGGILGALG